MTEINIYEELARTKKNLLILQQHIYKKNYNRLHKDYEYIHSSATREHLNMIARVIADLLNNQKILADEIRRATK